MFIIMTYGITFLLKNIVAKFNLDFKLYVNFEFNNSNKILFYYALVTSNVSILC